MHAIVDVTITPLGTGSASISDYVAAAEGILRQNFPDLTCRLNPMTTTIEGDLDRILEAIRKMHEAPFEKGAPRVSTTIRIDDRRDGKQASMKHKVEAVENKLMLK